MIQPLQQLFADTTIESASAADFLLGIPGYLEIGYANGAPPEARRLLFRMDNFEFELRQHLAGETRTRYALNRAVRTFQAFDETAARILIRLSLEAVETKLLVNEWYELLPHYYRTCEHIQHQFTI